MNVESRFKQGDGGEEIVMTLPAAEHRDHADKAGGSRQFQIFLHMATRLGIKLFEIDAGRKAGDALQRDPLILRQFFGDSLARGENVIRQCLECDAGEERIFVIDLDVTTADDERDANHPGSQGPEPGIPRTMGINHFDVFAAEKCREAQDFVRPAPTLERKWNARNCFIASASKNLTFRRSPEPDLMPMLAHPLELEKNPPLLAAPTEGTFGVHNPELPHARKRLPWNVFSAMELKNAQRIAVFKLRNIGDVLMITPSLHALRLHYPRARITAIVNSVTDSMLRNNPDIDEILVYNRDARKGSLRQWLSYELSFASEIRKRGFDLTIDFTGGDRSLWYALFSGASRRVGFRHYRWGRLNWRTRVLNDGFRLPDKSMHEVEKHAWLLKQIGISGGDGALCLKTDPVAEEWARQLINAHPGKKVVHVHPVSRWLFKCWEDSSMAAVIDWLQKDCQASVIVSASNNPRERQRMKRILALCKTVPTVLDGNVTLEQLTALCARSDCFFGVDTAPMHIAAAVGTPAVALFGPSNPEHWHPWSKNQITLSKDCPCRTSGGQTCDWGQTRACLAAITVEEVEEALDKLL
jgi:heptosyltransferase-3